MNPLKETGVRTSFTQKPAPTASVDWCNVARVTIDMLPDIALLEIFHIYVNDEWIDYDLGQEAREEILEPEAWYTLVHVCRKWRSVVFGSPHRLGLRLCCSASTPVKETLGVWPPLPIVIIDKRDEKWDLGHIIAAVEHNDRICELELMSVPSSQMEKVFAAMQQPFPALTRLWLCPKPVQTAAVVPASFLGGSTPRLQKLWMTSISFPGLTKLLLSATLLVNLDIRNIPHSGYISPEAMVTSLSVLNRLEYLEIGFESPRSRPDGESRRPPPLTRILLPALTLLTFRGVGKYLEDLVARIDAPLLDDLDITFFHQLIFDTPQLSQFISRTPKLGAHGEARVVFSDGRVSITLAHPRTLSGRIRLGISCTQSDWKLSFLAQVCSSSFPPAFIPAVEHLYIQTRPSGMHWQDDMENSQWVELLHSFTGVGSLYIYQYFTPLIAPALQELVEEEVTEVLPALQTLFLEDPIPSSPAQEGIEQFVAARQLAGHPIAASPWGKRIVDAIFEHDY